MYFSAFGVEDDRISKADRDDTAAYTAAGTATGAGAAVGGGGLVAGRRHISEATRSARKARDVSAYGRGAGRGGRGHAAIAADKRARELKDTAAHLAARGKKLRLTGKIGAGTAAAGLIGLGGTAVHSNWHGGKSAYFPDDYEVEKGWGSQAMKTITAHGRAASQVGGHMAQQAAPVVRQAANKAVLTGRANLQAGLIAGKGVTQDAVAASRGAAQRGGKKFMALRPVHQGAIIGGVGATGVGGAYAMGRRKS